MARSSRAARRARQAKIRMDRYLSKYPSQRITYKGRYIKSKGTDVRLDIDVRNFIQPDNFVLNFAKVAGAMGKLKSWDHKAWRIQKAVCDYMTYVYDEQNAGYTEFWQFPFETLSLRCGDCEDGAILMASAMLASGIPPNRIRIHAGWVKTGNHQQPWGGHAYVVYLRVKDGNPVILDWCYYEDPQTHIYHKPIIHQNTNYGDVWFSFNNDGSWGSMPIRFTNRKELESKYTGKS